MDRYYSIAGPVSGLYKEKGSRFIGYAAPVTSVEEALGIVELMRKEHPKARHHCYAYRIGPDKTLYRFNDDGEPTGTGGKPILGQIDSFELSDIVVVVTRYFGGKLLGASGLATAYKLGAQDALRQASVRTIERKIHYEVHFAYGVMGTLMDAINRFEGTIEEQCFTDDPHLVFSLPLSHPVVVIDQIIAHALAIYPEEVAGQRKFDQLNIRVKSSD